MLYHRSIAFHGAASTVAWLLVCVQASAQTTWYVDDDACPGPSSGTIGDPYCSIQDAIDDLGTLDGDTVEVAEGTYGPFINFNGKAITVRSSDPSDPAVVAATIIDGGLTLVTVVTCDSGEGPDTILSGLTITGGRGMDLGGGFIQSGGGMYIENSSPTVTDCVFTGNEAIAYGGGIFNTNGSPSVSRCSFFDNTADGASGGGLYSELGNPTVTKCTFIGNSATFGGGMFTADNNTSVTECVFNGNSAVGGGGGLYVKLSNTVITNCSFSGNTATIFGGAVFIGNVSPTITNCSFSDNSVSNATGGGGIFNAGADANPTVTNCVFWNNNPDEICSNSVDSNPVFTFCDVQGGFTGAGNLDLDPQFADADGIDNIPGTADDDLRLPSTSPCIDEGDSTTPGLNGIIEDLDGEPRFLNASVDMGAYESGHCPTDTDGSGAVNVFDLLAVLANWGPCLGCPEDNDGNGTVNVFDLLAMLAAWGACP